MITIFKNLFENKKFIYGNELFNFNLILDKITNLYLNITLFFANNGFIYIYYGNYEYYKILNFYGFEYTLSNANFIVYPIDNIKSEKSYYEYENNTLTFYSNDKNYNSWQIKLINTKENYEFGLINEDNNLNFKLGFVNNNNPIYLTNKFLDVKVNSTLKLNPLFINNEPNILKTISITNKVLNFDILNQIRLKYVYKNLVKEKNIINNNPYFYNNKYTFFIKIKLCDKENIPNDKIEKIIQKSFIYYFKGCDI